MKKVAQFLKISEQQFDKFIKACENDDDDTVLDSLLEKILDAEDTPKKPLSAKQKKENKSIWDKISD